MGTNNPDKQRAVASRNLSILDGRYFLISMFDSRYHIDYEGIGRDMELGGEVHTSVAQEGGLYSIAKAEVFRPDGSSDVVGTVRYTVAGSETILYGDTLVTPNYGTEAALLQEVSWQAQSKGAHRLRVWIPDGSPYAEKRWLRHGFLPTERDPGARGVHWQRRI